MVPTWQLVLAGVVLYSLVAMGLKQRQILPEFVKVSGPLTTIHTQRGKAFLNRLAERRRFWRAWGNVGVGIALLFLVGLFLTVLFSGYQNLVSPDISPIQSPQDALVIPGVNRFLPLAAAPDIIIGLLVGLVVHEGGHGLLSRVEDIEIDSMGVVLFALLPIGAFVEPDEEDRKRADRGAQTRMFAAGVTNNFAITIIAFALLFGPVTGAIAVADGVPVGNAVPNSSAAEAGVERGDLITAINGTPVANDSEFEDVKASAGSGPLTVDTRGGDRFRVNRSLLVVNELDGGPFGIEVGQTVTAVNGTPIRTEAALDDALRNRTTATLTMDNGTNATGPVGAYAVAVSEDGPLADAGAPEGESVVITRIDGVRTVDATALAEYLAETDPGTTVPVQAWTGGQFETYNVTLGSNDRTGGALVGVSQSQPGITGIVVDDFGIRTYPADLYLGFLSGDGVLGGLGDGSLGRSILLLLTLPFAAVADPRLGYNFAGFLDPITNFFVIQGPLSALGGGVFFLANVLFWTGWVNFNLGLFNCIPAFPLDGGHILRNSTEAVLSRTPFDSRRHVTAVTTTIGITMLAGLLLMLFGPALLA